MNKKEKSFIAVLVAGMLILIGIGIFTFLQERELLLSTNLARTEYQYIQLLDRFSDNLRNLRREGFYYTVYRDEPYLVSFNNHLARLDFHINEVRQEYHPLETAGGIDSALDQARTYADQWQQLIQQAQTQMPRETVLEAARKQADALDALLNTILENTKQSLMVFTQENNRIMETARDAMLAVALLTVLTLILITVAVSALLRNYTINRRLLAQTERLKNWLVTKNEDMEMVISVVSHDLWTPLVNIKGFSKELSSVHKRLNELRDAMHVEAEQANTIDDILQQELPESISFIENGAETMEKLIGSLVKVVRAGQVPLTPEQIDVTVLITEILKDFKYRIEQNQVQVEIEPLPSCWADRLQVRQVFANLIDNAIKFHDPQRPLRIHITGEVDGSWSQYHVEDNGIGIDAGDIDKAFSMYQRLQTNGSTGEGLGLALSRRMAERNGGTLKLESKKGKGTCFHIHLPATENSQL